jgi:hypothetical protein
MYARNTARIPTAGPACRLFSCLTRCYSCHTPAESLMCYSSAIMPKRLVILAVSVLLAVSATAQPSKGATKDKVAGVANPQAKGQSDEQRRENPPTVVVQVAPQQPDASETKKKEDTDAELARYTLLLAVFTGVLVVVSAVQGYFLYRQAGHLRTHAGHLDELVNASSMSSGVMTGIGEAIQKQSNLMNKTLILQYRPKLIIRNAISKGFSDEIGEGMIAETVRCALAFQIVNVGGSAADIVSGEISLLSIRVRSPEEETEARESPSIGISPRTLQPGERVLIETGIDTRIPNNARWTKIYNGVSSHRIFLLGTIWYRDELGIPRQTGLYRKYDPKTTRFDPQKANEEEYSD